jgi:hypothetical protein
MMLGAALADSVIDTISLRDDHLAAKQAVRRPLPHLKPGYARVTIAMHFDSPGSSSVKVPHSR